MNQRTLLILYGILVLVGVFSFGLSARAISGNLLIGATVISSDFSSPEATLDNSSSTFAGTANISFPHYLVYDLGEGNTILPTRLSVAPRDAGDGSAVKNVILYGSSDGTNWVNYSSGLIENFSDPSNEDVQFHSIDFCSKTVPFRYWKFEIEDSWSETYPNYAQIFEVALYSGTADSCPTSSTSTVSVSTSSLYAITCVTDGALTVCQNPLLVQVGFLLSVLTISGSAYFVYKFVT